jgi:hypothetical protein
MFSIADSNAFDELEQFKKRISADSESRLLRKAILAAEDEAVALIIICANL